MPGAGEEVAQTRQRAFTICFVGNKSLLEGTRSRAETAQEEGKGQMNLDYLSKRALETTNQILDSQRKDTISNIIQVALNAERADALRHAAEHCRKYGFVFPAENLEAEANKLDPK